MAKQAIIGCTVTAVIEDDEGKSIGTGIASTAQEDLRYAIQQRVIRNGFLPPDLLLEDFEITQRTTLTLFLITAENEHGDSLDLFVWADDSDEAIATWRAHFSDAAQPEAFVFTVVKIPTSAKRGAVDWSEAPPRRFGTSS